MAKDSKNKKDLSNIAFTLANGKFEGVGKKIYIFLFLVLVIICVGFITLFITLATIDLFESEQSVGEYVSTIIIVVLAFSLILTFGSLDFIRNEKIRKKVNLWVEDAVELSAYSKNIGTIRSTFGIPLTKLQVEFEYNGVNCVRTTETEERGIFDWGRPVGYFGGLSKYADRQIKILYSPKYDQAMILKD